MESGRGALKSACPNPIDFDSLLRIVRVAALFGPGSSQRNLEPFRFRSDIAWSCTMPTPSESRDAVLIFGGDGTVHRHLACLLQLQVPLLVVPCGSGNDFARSLGLRSVQDAIRAWRDFCAGARNSRAIDVGVISHASQPGRLLPPQQTFFCCVAGVGLDAKVAERANRLPRWLRARGGYAFSLLAVLPGFAPLPMTISTGAAGVWSQHSAGPLMLAAFANTPMYGGGLRIAPRAQLDDGKLDLCLVRGMNNLELVSLFPIVYFGQHTRLSKVDYFQAENARIESEIPLQVYADGEPVGATPVEVSLRPGALRVIVPA